MLDLHHVLETKARETLTKLDISGSVVGVCFVYDKGCPMIRITFCSDVEPKPVLFGFDYLEKDNENSY